MLIDFHCHTLATKMGESTDRNVTPKLFKEKISEAGIKIACITNHNKFDNSQYSSLKKEVKDVCEVWPGIELDVKGKFGPDGHVVLVCDPSESEKFNKICLKITENYTPDNFKISIDELVGVMKGINLIFIAHYLKSKQLSLQDIEYLESIVIDKRRVFKEPADLTAIGILNSHGHRAVIGSDNKNWKHYEKNIFGELKLEVKGFSNFIKLVEKDIALIKDHIKESFYRNFTVYGDSKKQIHPFNIPIYKDVNIIFGNKGSGKSEIIKSLRNEYDKSNEKYVYYEGGDKTVWFNDLLSVSHESYFLHEIFDDVPNEELISLIDYKDEECVPLSHYRNYFMEERTNNNQKRMKASTIQKNHLYDDKKIKKLKKEYQTISAFINSFSTFEIVKLEYLMIQNFTEQLNYLKKATFNLLQNEWINQKSNLFFDTFVDNIARYISENTGKASKPVETGFGAFASKRLDLKSNLQVVEQFLEEQKKQREDYYIGNISGKGPGYIKEKLYFVNKNNFANINLNTINCGITNLREMIKFFKRISINIYSNSLDDEVSKLRAFAKERKIKSIDSFIIVERGFYVDNEEYSPSKGEMSILALQYELLSKRDHQVFLIDEPELSLGSLYIESDIVPLINSLATSKKVVVIATHDANIAVRSRPLNSVLKTTNNGKYITHIGNMFTDQLINIDDNVDILSWKEESLAYLEGGNNAFIERGYLYDKRN